MIEWLTITLGEKSTPDDLILNMVHGAPFHLWNFVHLPLEDFNRYDSIGIKFRFSHEADMIHFKMMFSQEWRSSEMVSK